MSKSKAIPQIVNEQPIASVQWVHRDTLTANHYNPNVVAPPELDLLAISILEDGWTQPIVVCPNREIVDGFHRWTVSGRKEVYALTGGYVPIVITKPRDEASQMMATVRHNRARGTHTVLAMAKIVQAMIDDNISPQEIAQRMQMEKEEVMRLANRVGVPATDIVTNGEWSSSWIPTEK